MVVTHAVLVITNSSTYNFTYSVCASHGGKMGTWNSGYLSSTKTKKSSPAKSSASLTIPAKKQISGSAGSIQYSNDRRSYTKGMYAEWSGPKSDGWSSVLATVEVGGASIRINEKYGGIGLNAFRGYAGIQALNDGAGVLFELGSLSAHLNIGDYAIEASVGLGAGFEFKTGFKGGLIVVGGISIVH